MSGARDDRRILPRPATVAAFAVGAALLASAAPLAAYAGSLALFGLPHVLTELRYVDGRFGRRTRRGHVVAIGLLLVLVVVLRSLAIAGAVDATSAVTVELGLVAVMAFAVAPALLARPLGAAIALLLGASLAAGSFVAPVVTAVLLAVLHNVTPAGFLVERLGRRGLGGRGVVALAMLFVGVPVLIASGWPAHVLARAGLAFADAGGATVGPLTSHVHVFVPRGWFGPETTAHVFAAATYLQLLHYGAVLLVLPRLLGPGDGAGDGAVDGAVDRPLVPWPRARVLGGAIAAAGAVAAVLFLRDFRGTRAAYGLAAAVHAWLEIPVLLLALAALGGRARSVRADDARLAASAA